MNKLGLYIHIPFCERKCNYCGFLSFSGCEDNLKKKYMAAMRNELRYRLGLLGVGTGGCLAEGGTGGYAVDTVFIGGGTPSTVEPQEIGEVLELVDTSSEVTLEANPGTLTREKLLAYRKMGINRLSMGVQSFDDELLQKLGRIHNAEMVYNNFSLARECGFNNINLDLMFGLPGQSLEAWENTLNTAIKLSPEHISFYSLQLEENTPFFKDFEAGKLELPSDELDREMYHRAIAILKAAGYHHYEISNAARISEETLKNSDICVNEAINEISLQNTFFCKHNYKYWSMDEYLGVGLGAASFLGGARFKNTDDINEYIEIWRNPESLEVLFGKNDDGRISEASTEAGSATDSFSGETFNENLMKKGTVDWHDNKLHDFVSEFVFTGLRKTEGIDLNEFENRFGVPFFEYYESQQAYVDFCIREGYMDTEDARLRLTEKGIDISNSIMAEFV